MRLRELIKPGQFGVYRRTYTDHRGNSVCCYVAINEQPFVRIGTSCIQADSKDKAIFLGYFGNDFARAVSLLGCGSIPEYYAKPFVFEPKQISGAELMEHPDRVLSRTLALNRRKVIITKENLDEDELRSFEEGFYSNRF